MVMYLNASHRALYTPVNFMRRIRPGGPFSVLRNEQSELSFTNITLFRKRLRFTLLDWKKLLSCGAIIYILNSIYTIEL